MADNFTPGSRGLTGLTTYHWAPVTDVKKIRAAGFSFLHQKTSEGADLPDNTYRNTLALCAAESFPIAPFHFYRPGADPVKQANFFFSLGSVCPLGPMADFEVEGAATAGIETDAFALFVKRIHELWGVWPDIYTAPAFWSFHYGEYLKWCAARGTLAFDFSLCGLAIANYGVAAPRIPAPWLAWKYWQDVMEIPAGAPGVTGHPDHEFYNGTVLPLLSPVPPGPGPAPVPSDAVPRLWGAAIAHGWAP